MSVAGGIIALSGGVGGAKLALGLAACLPPGQLAILANTADDFEHLGLSICPDLDTVMYTLAGLADPERGWGLAGETWQCMDALAALGGEDWFRLGDRDLATHLQRSLMLARGEGLAAVTAALCSALGVRHALIPMSEQRVRTVLDTDRGELAFQTYFVRERCAPVVRAIRYAGASEAVPAPALIARLASAESVVICPSNPWLSVDPILAVGDLRSRIAAKKAVAVSPIVGGKALKGPAATIMAQLDLEPSALEVARHYRGLIRGFVIDRVDADQAKAVRALGMAVLVTDTVMTDAASKQRLAAEVLAFLADLPA